MKLSTFSAAMRRARGNLRPPVAPSFTTFSAPDVHYDGATTAPPSFTYTGTEPITVSYKWQTSPDSNTWSDIGGATSATSPVWAGADAGVWKRPHITLTGPGGTATQTGNGSRVIASGTGGGGGGSPGDIGDWTVVTPVMAVGASEAARMATTETGSRIYYIDPVSGSDPTVTNVWATTGLYGNGAGEVYFWNGTNIIDSQGNTSPGGVGTLYGTDPMLPSASVKAFKSWLFVAPRGNGNFSPGRVSDLVWTNTVQANGRNGKPDWFLFKRGTTTDIRAEALARGFTTQYVGFSVPGGPAAGQENVIGAYGVGARPKITKPFDITDHYLIRQWSTAGGAVPFRHVLYTGLHFNGHDRTANTVPPTINFLYLSSNCINIVFEDMLFDAVSTQTQLGDEQIRFRRCLFLDNFRTSGSQRCQGLFTSGNAGQKLQIDDCIFARNGHTIDPSVTWPQTSVLNHIYNRNMYLSGRCDHANSWAKNTVSIGGASGDQYRCGMFVERNFFNTGYISLLAQGGDTRGVSGSLKNNVQQIRYKTYGDSYGRMEVGAGARDVEVSGNIITNAGLEVAEKDNLTGPFGITSLSAAQPPQSWVNPTTGCLFTNNICYYEGQANNVTVWDGVDGNPNTYSPFVNNYPPTQSFTWTSDGIQKYWEYPGVSGNTVKTNIFVGGTSLQKTYTKYYGATAPFPEGTDLNTYGVNTFYATAAAATTAQSWPAPNRTLKTYLESLGHTVTDADDAIKVYTDHVKANMKKGSWDYAYTAQAIVNYVRAGFGLTAI